MPVFYIKIALGPIQLGFDIELNEFLDLGSPSLTCLPIQSLTHKKHDTDIKTLLRKIVIYISYAVTITVVRVFAAADSFLLSL